jgi:hypothetical protein
MKPLIEGKDNKVQGADAFYNAYDVPGSGFIVINQIIDKNKNKVVRRNLEYIING